MGGWSAIIAALLVAFGPLLSDMLKDCAKKTGKKVEKELEETEVPEDKEEAYRMALDTARDVVPKRQILRRLFLTRTSESDIPKALAEKRKLDKETVAELKALAKVM